MGIEANRRNKSLSPIIKPLALRTKSQQDEPISKSKKPSLETLTAIYLSFECNSTVFLT